MNKLNLKIITASIFMFAVLFSATIAQAALVNGSLEGLIQNNRLPDGWFSPSSDAVNANSPDTMNASNNVGVSGLLGFGATPSASPNGGTWVGVGANENLLNESFAQTITDFSVGTQYTLSWYDANFGIATDGANYTGTNSFSAFLDSTLIGTGSVRSLAAGWSLQTFTFTPTAASQTLTFRLASTTKSYLSIDGISLTSPVTAVPEPQTWAFMLAGLLMISLQIRNRKASNRKINL